MMRRMPVLIVSLTVGRYLDAEDVDEVPVVAASPTDEPIAEEQDMDVEIVRMMPPRKPAEEPVRESALSQNMIRWSRFGERSFEHLLTVGQRVTMS